MPEVTIDPQEPIEIRAVFDTPLLVTVSFLYRPAGSSKFVMFYQAAVAQEVPSQEVVSTLDPQARGTRLLLSAVFYGKKNTLFRGTIRLFQRQLQIGKPFKVNGTTGKKLVKATHVEVDLK